MHDEEDNVIKNITVISLIFRFLIDLFFGLSFLALAYSFGIKRLEFETNYLKKNGKFTTFVKEGSNEDTEFKGMSSLNIINLFNKRKNSTHSDYHIST